MFLWKIITCDVAQWLKRNNKMYHYLIHVCLIKWRGYSLSKILNAGLLWSVFMLWYSYFYFYLSRCTWLFGRCGHYVSGRGGHCGAQCCQGDDWKHSFTAMATSVPTVPGQSWLQRLNAVLWRPGDTLCFSSPCVNKTHYRALNYKGITAYCLKPFSLLSLKWWVHAVCYGTANVKLSYAVSGTRLLS